MNPIAASILHRISELFRIESPVFECQGQGNLLMHERAIYNSDHELFRTSARRFFREELEPNIDQWEKDGRLPREFWLKAGENGFHCCGVPVEYGGAGADFLYNMVLSEEVGFAIGGASVGFSVSSDICLLYTSPSPRDS